MSESEDEYDSSFEALPEHNQESESEDYSLETSEEASTSISDPSKFDEHLTKLRELEGGAASEEAATEDNEIPFLIKEPKLHDNETLVNLKDMQDLSEEVHTDDFSQSFDQNASSPDESADIDQMSLDEQRQYYKKLAAHELRERVLKLSEERKLSRGEKQKLKMEKQKETFQEEFELCEEEVQRDLRQLSQERKIELHRLEELLDASDIDQFEVSEGIKEEITEFRKKLARASPINDHFIENIGRLVFNYKEVEKQDFGLTIEDLFALDEKIFERLALELPEYNGLGDVDIALYRQLEQDGIIEGTRQYTQQQEDQQREKLAEARVEVRKKFPWMFKTHANSASKLSENEKVERLKQHRLEKNQRRGEQVGSLGKRGK